MVRGGGRTHDSTKSPEDSLMSTQEESDDISFRVSKLEDLFKGPMRTDELFNLEEMMVKRTGNMDNKMDNMDKIEERMGHVEENGIKMQKRTGHMENNIV